jgi:hypothetical protein
MAKYTFIVLSNPISPAQEDEYNKWYDDQHIPDVLSLDGYVTAQRFRLADSQVGENNPYKYLTLYEMETDNLDAAITELMDWFANGMIVTDAFDLKNMGPYIFAPITEKVHQAAILRPRRTA